MYIYISMCQSTLRVMHRMLRICSGQLDIACIRGKNDINTVQFLAQTDRFVSQIHQCIVTSSRV